MNAFGHSRKASALEPYERNRCAKRVMSLCKEKGYRLETSIMAVNILDKLLTLAGPKFLPTDTLKISQVPVIVTTVTILADKLEQPMTPSINRMIKLLTADEERFVDKAKVITMEGTIIKLFNFEFGFLSPLTFIERFLRLIDYQVEMSSNFQDGARVHFASARPSLLLYPVAADVLKYLLSKCELLWGRQPSLVAAAIIQVAQRVLRSVPSQLPPLAIKWVLVNQWDSRLTEQTGIKHSDFEDFAQMLEHAYRANGGGNAQHLIFA